MTRDMPTVDELAELLSLARRLPPPGHRNPEAFHQAKSELIDKIRQLAARAERRAL